MYASQSMFVYAVYLITSNVSAASPASSKTMSGKWNRAEAQPRVGVWNTLRATAALVLLTSAMLFSFVSKLIGVVYLAAVATTSLLCPMLLVHMQQYRTDVQGPWDVAVGGVASRSRTHMRTRQRSGSIP